MKKFGILLLSLCIATPALADLWTNCTNNGGTMITANSYGNDKGGYCNDSNDSSVTNNCNGKRFCVSGNAMNWWSTFTWCEAVGGHIVSFESACPNTQALYYTAAGFCANLTGALNAGVWGNILTASGVPYTFQPNGSISREVANRNGGRAFCEE